MADIRFDEKLVVFPQGSDVESVERELAARLYEEGCVADTFADALTEREKDYPTALEVGEHNVAIPHTEAEHTKQGAICVGVLREPVSWARMDDADERCDVELVVMLALSDPHGHLEMLQKVIGLVQDQELVGKILASTAEADVVALVAPKLL